VLQKQPVTGPDLGGDGLVVDAAVRRWVDGAGRAYLDQCLVLKRTQDQPGRALRCRAGALPRGVLLGRPDSVIVTASASEFRPTSITILVRLRPIGGDIDNALNATCTIVVENGVTGELCPLDDEIRDELIALEQSAQHVN
jgi:hypothetical protein